MAITEELWLEGGGYREVFTDDYVDSLNVEIARLTKDHSDLVLEVEILVRQRDELVAALEQWKESTLKHGYPHEHIAMLMTDKSLASVKESK